MADPFPPSPIQLPALDNSLGATEVGILVTVFLLGVTSMQVYVYFRTFPKDPVFLKLLVPFIWLLYLAHVILITHALYTLTISYYGQPSKLIKQPDTTIMAIFFGSLLDRIVQVFFAYRLWRFSRSILLFVVLCGVSVFILTVTYVAAVKALASTSQHQFSEQYGWLLTTAFISDAVVDTFTASALCWCLSRERKKSRIEKTSLIIDRLIMYSLQTGLVTSMAAIAAAVTFQTMKGNSVWVGIYATLPGFFSNAFLAALNSRRALSNLGNASVNTVSTPTALRDLEAPRQYSTVNFAPPGKSQLSSASEHEAKNMGVGFTSTAVASDLAPSNLQSST